MKKDREANMILATVASLSIIQPSLYRSQSKHDSTISQGLQSFIEWGECIGHQDCVTNKGRNITKGVDLLLTHWADVLNIKKTQVPAVFTSNKVKMQTGYKIIAGDSSAIVKFLNDHEKGKHLKRDLTTDEWTEVARLEKDRNHGTVKTSELNAACQKCIDECKERSKKEHHNDGTGMDPWIVKAATDETKEESAITVVLPKPYKQMPVKVWARLKGEQVFITGEDEKTTQISAFAFKMEKQAFGNVKEYQVGVDIVKVWSNTSEGEVVGYTERVLRVILPFYAGLRREIRFYPQIRFEPEVNVDHEITGVTLNSVAFMNESQVMSTQEFSDQTELSNQRNWIFAFAQPIEVSECLVTRGMCKGGVPNSVAKPTGVANWGDIDGMIETQLDGVFKDTKVENEIMAELRSHDGKKRLNNTVTQILKEREHEKDSRDDTTFLDKIEECYAKVIKEHYSDGSLHDLLGAIFRHHARKYFIFAGDEVYLMHTYARQSGPERSKFVCGDWDFVQPPDTIREWDDKFAKAFNEQCKMKRQRIV